MNGRATHRAELRDRSTGRVEQKAMTVFTSAITALKTCFGHRSDETIPNPAGAGNPNTGSLTAGNVVAAPSGTPRVPFRQQATKKLREL